MTTPTRVLACYQPPSSSRFVAAQYAALHVHKIPPFITNPSFQVAQSFLAVVFRSLASFAAFTSLTSFTLHWHQTTHLRSLHAATHSIA
jgi:hypothetical protein